MENSFFINALKQAHWVVSNSATHQNFDISTFADGRMAHVPFDVKEFIHSFAVCANPTDTVWFLSAMDYSDDSENSFPWNEFEQQSMMAASDTLMADIAAFWSSHLPILFSVKNGYQYVAVGIAAHNKGKFFYGREPEYEDVVAIATSFTEFKEKYIEALNGNPPAYYDFIS